MAFQFADDSVLFVEVVRKLQRAVAVFYIVCLRRNLRVNVGKNKFLKVEVDDFTVFYKVSVPVAGSCEIILGEERIGEVKVLVFGDSFIQAEI